MNPALWVAKTGLDAQQTNMAVISQNLANVNTTGYKKGRAVFEDLLYQTVSQVGAATSQNTQSPSGLELGTGVNLVSTEKVYTQGNMNQTGNSLDMAINGNGFFQILMPDGSLAYTRDGNFQVSSTGQVVTAQGFPLQPAVTIPAGAQSISIGQDGTVQAQLQGQSAPSTVGTLQLANFINPTGLQPIGNNLLTETASSGTATTGSPASNGMGAINQGYTEASNVDVVEEMVNMIETQRAYEMNTKAIETNDQMLQFLDQNL
ncbi:MAG TPA: flagellar basal-body rod protein FlgG [Steroidobacteraceae bacterium]|jgi:flagellar basal-body rod protein FlgG|nr:flagellar basal-body rod protein FlgG [Steroidobacteraceae bacterium]